MSAAPDSDVFMSRVEAMLSAQSPSISPLAAGLVVAVDMGIADSRTFSRALGVEHALVLREIAGVSGPEGFVTVTARHAKTLRTSLALSARGALLLRDAKGRLGGRLATAR
jgi:hypothetical protein